MIQALAFLTVLAVVVYFSFSKYRQIWLAIQLGQSENISGAAASRWKNMLLFALGQRKMFAKPVSGIFHAFIYLAFIFTQIETIEILVDGVSGNHRFFANKIGFLYPLLINTIEWLSILALIATIIFLWRRNVSKVRRFQSAELKGWPFKDANMILLGEIVLIVSIMMMNGAYQYLQIQQPDIYPDGGRFYLSSQFTLPLFESSLQDIAVFSERFFWWLHVLVIFGFIVYLPYSKHLHIFLAFPNSYFADTNERGRMKNIPEIQNEVRGMFGLEAVATEESKGYFGASDIHQMGWRNILQAFSCTECGRCTAVCPANLTGKKLSPRKIMMDIRDRSEELVKKSAFQKAENGEIEITDGKSLFDRISKEEIYACTSCNACVEACPVLINPLQPILELRRYDILMNSGGPPEWLPVFNSLETNQCVWAMTDSRTQWSQNS
ncbi:MAG: (Fe-S)-binding protein [Saprospiraceae bacterium]|nr:(Fe-S)-binding protein [Saprospiraceae bacterium]